MSGGDHLLIWLLAANGHMGGRYMTYQGSSGQFEKACRDVLGVLSCKKKTDGNGVRIHITEKARFNRALLRRFDST